MESVIPALEPPQPKITKIEPGSREMTIYFECPGYNDKQIKAWFEVELNPPAPTLLGEQIDKKKEEKHHKKINDITPGNNNNNNNHLTVNNNDNMHRPSRAHHRKSRMIHRKSKWIRRATSARMKNLSAFPTRHLGAALPLFGFNRSNTVQDSFDDTKKEDREDSYLDLYPEEYDDESFIPYFRRNQRYLSSPIKITPLNNGQEYSVRIKAVTLSGTKNYTI